MIKRLAWVICSAAALLPAQEVAPYALPGGARVCLGMDLVRVWQEVPAFQGLEVQGSHEVWREGRAALHHSALDLSYFPISWLGVRVALEGDNRAAGQAIPEGEGPLRDRPGAGLGIVIRF